MKSLLNPQIYFLLGIIIIVYSSCSDDKTLPSCDGIEWEYTGEHGPDHWDELCAGFSPCGGSSQSPVNISSTLIDTALQAIQINYAITDIEVVNKGHTLQYNVDAGSSITINGTVYQLLQFHTHTPSEHTLIGSHFPLEIHFVHKNEASGNLAVIGVFFEEGAENGVLKNLTGHLPTQKDSTHNESTTYLASELFPSSRTYFTYSGSLTTPPCSEIVTWFVFEFPVEASAEQIQEFEHLEHENARPVQPLHFRTIKLSTK